MKNKAMERPQLEKLLEMAKSRKGAPRLVIGIKTPIEIREALLKSDRGEVKRGVGAGIHILLERPQRDALNELAISLDLNAAETIRMLVRAATILGSKGVATFANAASRLETANLEAKFKKAGEKERSTSQGPELDDDSGGEESAFQMPKTGTPLPELRRRKKGRKADAGAPRPDESGGVP